MEEEGGKSGQAGARGQKMEEGHTYIQAPDIAVTVGSLAGLNRNYTATEGGWGRDRKCRLEGDVSSSSPSSSRPQKWTSGNEGGGGGRCCSSPPFFPYTEEDWKRTRKKKKRRCHSILFSPEKGRRFAEENGKNSSRRFHLRPATGRIFTVHHQSFPKTVDSSLVPIPPPFGLPEGC